MDIVIVTQYNWHDVRLPSSCHYLLLLCTLTLFSPKYALFTYFLALLNTLNNCECYIDLTVFKQIRETHCGARVRFARTCSRPNHNSVTVVLLWSVSPAIQSAPTAAMSAANVLMESVQHVAMTYCQNRLSIKYLWNRSRIVSA